MEFGLRPANYGLSESPSSPGGDGRDAAQPASSLGFNRLRKKVFSYVKEKYKSTLQKQNAILVPLASLFIRLLPRCPIMGEFFISLLTPTTVLLPVSSTRLH